MPDRLSSAKACVPFHCYLYGARVLLLSFLFLPAPQTIQSQSVKAPSTREPLQTLKGHTNVIFSVAFSHDGHLLATASADSTVSIWDTSTWKKRYTLPVAAVRSVAFSPDDKTLAASNGSLWDTTTGQRVTHDAIESGAYAVAFSPDGMTLAVAKGDGRLILVDTPTWKIRQTFKQTPGYVSFVLFSPDGGMLAVGTEKSVILWNLKRGRIAHSLQGQMDRVSTGAFSPDGRLLATGGCSNFTAQLWDTRTGKMVRSLRKHHYEILSVAFSPDGKLLATGSVDATATLWNVRTGRPLYTFVDVTERIYALAFSPDGSLLATGDAYAKTMIWAVPETFLGEEAFNAVWRGQ